MARVNLTQKFIEARHCPNGRLKVDFFDDKQTGLIYRETNKGKKSFYLRFTDHLGKRVEKRFADATIVPLVKAREEAKRLLGLIALGQDPFEKPIETVKVPSFAQFIEQQYMPFIKGYKRSWNTDESLLRNHILPVLGKMRMNEVNRGDLVGLFSQHRLNHQPGSTNRIIILCRYIFNCAIRWEVAGMTKNPSAEIPLYPVNNIKDRFLSADEAKRLFAALEQSDSVMLPYIVKMLLLTGARKNEVLNARWADFDLKRKLWTIEFNKSGKTRHVPMSDLAVELVLSLPRFEGCEFAFANPKTLKPYVHIFSSWDTARKKAKLPDVRIHDLRHSFASFLVNNGRSLYEVQKILGHTQVKTTQRYAHLSQDSLRSAANEVGRALDGVFAVKSVEAVEQTPANDSKALEVLPKASGSK